MPGVVRLCLKEERCVSAGGLILSCLAGGRTAKACDKRAVLDGPRERGQAMERFELTTEHSASSYGKAVLVDRETGEAYGPADLLEVEGEIVTAAEVMGIIALTE